MESFFPEQYCGGSYLRAEPTVLNDVKNFGFNMLSFANNHSMDFSHEGLMATKNEVDKAGFPNAGAGANLDEAAASAYLDTREGRVALISAVSTMSADAAMAGKQSRRFRGRPGVNGLRIDEHIEVTKAQLDVIDEIINKSNVNGAKNISIAEALGYPKRYIDTARDEVRSIKQIKIKTRYKANFYFYFNLYQGIKMLFSTTCMLYALCAFGHSPSFMRV
ncbi:MAG: CapA family protein [Clostridia bacterium]|nr:CapA family protein [Clostridia bacterium]